MTFDVTLLNVLMSSCMVGTLVDATGTALNSQLTLGDYRRKDPPSFRLGCKNGRGDDFRRGRGCLGSDDDTCEAEVIIEIVTLFAKFFRQWQHTLVHPENVKMKD